MKPNARDHKTQTIIAPGRVNLLGEHVDYNDGPVLPVAIDLTMSLDFSPSDSNLVELHALDFGKTIIFDLDHLDDKLDISGHPLPNFALYPASVAWACRQADLSVRGMRATYTSNIPIGSGVSSSAAVEVAFMQAFKTLGGWDIDRMTLVELAQKGENDYVGVHSGIMDQFACMFGMENRALYLDTRSLDWEPVPLPEDVAIIVANSQVPRELSGSGYNDRQAACQEAVVMLKEFLPNITSLRDVTPKQFETYAERLPETIRKRARHVIEEIARVEQSVVLLKEDDIAGFGAKMVEGHKSLRDLYEVSTPELDALVEIAPQAARLLRRKADGCGVRRLHCQPGA